MLEEVPGGENADLEDTPEEELTDELVLRFGAARCFPGGCPQAVHLFFSDPPS